MAGKKVLVVDDEPSLLESLTTRFVSEGFEVCSAVNGDEAITKAKSEKPVAIIMDVMLPQTSGYEAMAKIRQDPATKKIPAIIFSGKSGMKTFFLDMPDVEFIQKPFDFKLLVDRVKKLIGEAPQPADQTKSIVLAGVEDLLVSKIRDLLSGLQFKVSTALHEAEAVALVKSVRPAMILCQFWEDENILAPQKIAQELLEQPSLAAIPFYVFCKESLSLEAMKYFKTDKILSYKETSDALRAVKDLANKTLV